MTVLFMPRRLSNKPPLIAHIVHRLDTGGLENGLVNLINNLPGDRYRHAVVCLTDYSGFRDRIERPDVEVIVLHKKEGKYPSLYGPLWKVIRQLRPDIVHTRNLATLEAQIPAYVFGVPHRIHGEHGRDVSDLYGKNRTYNMLRRGIRPLIHRYITVSRDLRDWLHETVGVPLQRISQIYNGVDIRRFSPAVHGSFEGAEPGFLKGDAVVIGTVGRMSAVKDQVTLVKAFLALLDSEPGARDFLRLMVIGDGPVRGEVQALLQQAGAASLAWLPGDRSDIPELLRAMDVFVLPSLGEGISNTILEAMSTGLPVVATRVGGNAELVREAETGALVNPGDAGALAAALGTYIRDKALRMRQGAAARTRVEQCFSLETMVEGYLHAYDQLLQGRRAGGGRADARVI